MRVGEKTILDRNSRDDRNRDHPNNCTGRHHMDRIRPSHRVDSKNHSISQGFLVFGPPDFSSR